MDVKTRKTLATRLSSVLLDILAEGTKTARVAPLKRGVKMQTAAVRGAKKSATSGTKTKVKSRAKGLPAQRQAHKAVLKPCPVTGIPNKHRRFSYLMPEARTPENLAKYKGAARKAALTTKAA